VIGGGNGSSNGTQQTIGTVRTSSTVTLPFEATPEEARLAELIPPVIVPDCRRGKELSSAMLATVSCSPPDASVTYSLFESPGTLSTYMNARVGLGDSERKCGQAPSGSSTYNAEGETVGRLVCYVRQSHAWIEWSNVRAVVYAYGYRADGDWKALFNFWNGAGPLVK
jgi:hypothetical protein